MDKEWHPVILQRRKDYKGRDIVTVEAPCELPRDKGVVQALPPLFVDGRQRCVHGVEYVGLDRPIRPGEIIGLWLEKLPS